MIDTEPLTALGPHVFAEEVADLVGDCGEYKLLAIGTTRRAAHVKQVEAANFRFVTILRLFSATGSER